MPMSLISESADLAPARAAPPCAEPSMAEVGDFVALMKPRVMSLVVFTALVGLVIAPGDIHPLLAAAALFWIAVGAGASGALNMWYDADIDAVMSRTANRPLPRGRILPREALAFGVLLSVGSVAALGLTANWTAAALLAFTIFFYVGIYTIGLKRFTPQNIVIGGAAGAFPPMIGWAAVTGEAFSMAPIVLFLIIFVWTPPHFWALALFRSADYARAGVPMLPVVAGDAETRRQILIYALALAPIGTAPWLLGFAGPAYGFISALLGALMIALSIQVYRETGNRAARRLFAFSILYLFALYAALLAEHGLGRAGALTLVW